jgi:alpha-N-arabinofuranosidase
VSIESPDGAIVYARGESRKLDGQWRQYSVRLETRDAVPTASARFVISTGEPGTFWLDQVSLFPATFRNRPNGNRVDLMQLMAGLEPSFLRLPGGNFRGQHDPPTAFSGRPIGPWRRAPDTRGRGATARAMAWACSGTWVVRGPGMEPVLGVYAGYSLNGTPVNPGAASPTCRTPWRGRIDYLTGDATTVWGARARGWPSRPVPARGSSRSATEDFFDGSGSYDALRPVLRRDQGRAHPGCR